MGQSMSKTATGLLILIAAVAGGTHNAYVPDPELSQLVHRSLEQGIIFDWDMMREEFPNVDELVFEHLQLYVESVERAKTKRVEEYKMMHPKRFVPLTITGAGYRRVNGKYQGNST